jgi:hypothetical protein
MVLKFCGFKGNGKPLMNNSLTKIVIYFIDYYAFICK